MDATLNNRKRIRKQPLPRPSTPPCPEKQQPLCPAKEAVRAEFPRGGSAKVYGAPPHPDTPIPAARLSTRPRTAHPSTHIVNPVPRLAHLRRCTPLTAAHLDTIRQCDLSCVDQWMARAGDRPIVPLPLPTQQRRRPSDALFARSERDALSHHSFPTESPEDRWVPRELLLYANEQRGEAWQQVAKLQHECQRREDRKMDAELGRMRAERKVAVLEKRIARMEEEHKADQSHKVAGAEERGRRQEAEDSAVQMKEIAASTKFTEQRVQARVESAQKALQSQIEALQSQIEAERATREALEKKLAAVWSAQEGRENGTTAQRELNNGPRITFSTGSGIRQPLPSTKERLPDETKTKKPILSPTHPAKKGQPSQLQNVPNTRASKKPAAKTATKSSVPNVP